MEYSKSPERSTHRSVASGIAQKKAADAAIQRMEDPDEERRRQEREKAAKQKERGMHAGKAFLQTGAIKYLNRNPHDAGPMAAPGSSRASTHDNGNRLAMLAAKNKAIREGDATRQDFAPSVVRSRAAEEKREMKQEETDKAEAREYKSEAYRPENKAKGAKNRKKKEEARKAEEDRESQKVRDMMNKKIQPETEGSQPLVPEPKTKVPAPIIKDIADPISLDYYFWYTGKTIFQGNARYSKDNRSEKAIQKSVAARKWADSYEGPEGYDLG